MDRPAARTTRAPTMDDRFPALDGIRGLAVIWVMMFHFSDQLEPVTLAERVLLMIAKAGWIGLEVFFVLSGYLITGILFDTRGTRDYLPTFYARRFLRVFPLYYGFLLGMVLVVTQVSPLDRGESRAFLAELPWYWSFLVNGLVGVARRWDVAPYHTSHFWSLSLEEQFYVFWPALMMLGGRERLLKLTGGVFVGSVLLRAGMRLGGVHGLTIFVFTPARLDALAAGAFLALAARGPRGFEPVMRWMRPLGASAAFALAAIFAARGELSPSDVAVQLVGLPAMACLSIVLVVAIVTRPGGRVDRFFQNGLLLFLGTYSYGIYVFHLPMMLVLRARGITFVALTGLVHSQFAAQILYDVVAGSASVAVALLSWHVYEKHFLRLKNRLYPLHPA